MKISIITACYNAEKYIGETMSSLVGQGFSGLEYIVVDGASNDGTAGIIDRFQDDISLRICEKDDGQYHAIQKGFDASSGDIMAWLNADDIYMPWTLSVVSEVFSRYPEVEWITGLPGFINDRGQCTAIHSSPSAYPQRFIQNGWYRENLGGYLQQESMFWRRSLWEKTAGLDLSLSLAADFRLWTEFARHAELVQVHTPLAAFRKLPGVQRSSVGADRYKAEVETVCSGLKRPPFIWRKVASMGLAARNLARMTKCRQAKVIAYSEQTKAWELVTLRRPIARIGFGQAWLEWALKKKTRG